MSESEKKKIKLITFAPHPNFGTCLQSYALNYVLRSMGHDVEFIYNYMGTIPLPFVARVKRAAKSLIAVFMPSYIEKREERKKREELERRERGEKKDPFVMPLPNQWALYILSKMPGYSKLYKKYKCKTLQWRKVYKFAFEDGNFHMRRIYKHSQYRKVTEETDVFITGSDQVWNPYCLGFDPMMFVEFGEDKKRIAYSSSVTISEFPESVRERAKNDLMKFSHIGVREESSVEMLNNLLERTDVRAVVDPTYLLSAEEWSEFGKKAQLEFELPEKYIFCYLLGDDRRDVYKKMVEEVKELTGISDVIYLECYDRTEEYLGGHLYMDAGPYEWVYLLEHSSYVCMDSFHATVFALKFQKDFVHTMKNLGTESGSQNGRMYDLLGRYGLLWKNYNPGGSDEWKTPVDYDKITPIIEAEIKDSMEFLRYEIEE